ncbi:MAG: SUMF1/EgtB/PvdO family nonheme iron enzyme [Nitrospinaceae bacterium]|nr:SUMF1/EgtB/PvdO family nonheme iron enzyme [Nitrospinaceae bacterium]NIX35829.1 SUMF1/EgtB/PvdO family nonheme iron enzyme [Nitrospinaceae bacterium]
MAIWSLPWTSAAAPPMAPPPKAMVLIPGGAYQAGSDPGQAYHMCQRAHPNNCRLRWFIDEKPSRSIFIDAFQMDRYEVTQHDFQQVMGFNPSEFKGSGLPVERVTWEEARQFCRKVGKRLPTEAEWERAARGDAKTAFPWGNRMATQRANICDRHCPKRWRETSINDGFATTAPVGSYPPNAFGLYDMVGNVYEWVADGYSKDIYSTRPSKNPRGPAGGASKKVIRGGSWINFSVGARPADRTEADPDERMDFTGFRCAR